MSSGAYSSVFLVSAGTAQSNAGDLLGSATMRSAVEEWREAFDVVLVHGSPLDRPDAAILASVMDAIVVVAQAGRTRAGDLLRLVELAAGPRSIVAGVVLEADRAEAPSDREAFAEQPPARVVAPAASRVPARSRQRLSRFRQDADAE
jgi:Mrp family chromosome partitioning ATPase